MRRLRRLAQVVLHVEGTPERVALAFAIGVFLAFFPIFGVHTAVALGVAFALRLSRAAILMGAWMNNPWTVAPMYTAGTLLGCALLGVPPAGLPGIAWSVREAAVSTSIMAGLRPLLLPFVVGNLALGAIAAGASFFVVRGVLRQRRRRTSS